MNDPSQSAKPAVMRFSVDPDTSGPLPTLVQATFTPMGPKKLRVEVSFGEPLLEERWPEVKFALLLVRPRGGRTIALHIHESGLWNEKWDALSTETSWSPDRRTLRADLSLPAKYQSIPESGPRTFTKFAEGWWPLMTKAQWAEAVDHRHRL